MSNPVDPFWGADVDDDDDDFDDDDNSSVPSTSSVGSEDQEDQEDLPQRQSSSTGKEILAIAIPALAGLAIDPLMVRTYGEN